MGSGPTEEGRLSQDTLVLLISICEGLLADQEWLARSPDPWPADLLGLRDRLAEELAERGTGRG